VTRVVTDPSRDALPEWLQEALPEDLEDADLFGLETAAIDDSVLLWGPPGAGKTTTAALRVVLVADKHDLGPRDMTVVTFRTSQSSILEERVVDEWGVFYRGEEDENEFTDPFKFWSTAHAVCCRATDFHDRFEEPRENGEELAGMVTNTDPDPALRFCREFGIRCYPRQNGAETRWTAFRALYEYCKNNLLDVGSWELPDSMLRGADHRDGETRTEYTQRVLAQDPRAHRLLQDFKSEWGSSASFNAVVEKWESWKAEHSVCDFYEQLEAGILGPLPPTRVVVVDELHDATPLMAAYFERLIDAADTAIVAGDPNQTINGFSGADRRVFTGLPGRVNTDLPVIQLPESYRCSDESLAAAQRMLRQHHAAPDLDSAGPGRIHRHECDHSFALDDGEWDLPVPSSPRSPVAFWRECGPDVMMLARTQTMLDAPAAALDRGGIIYQSQDGACGNWSRRVTVLSVLESLVEFGPAGRDPAEADSTALSTSDVLTFVEHVSSRYLDGERDPRRDVQREIRDFRRSDDEFTVADLHGLVESGFWQTYGCGIESIEELVRIDARRGFSQSTNRDLTSMWRAWRRYKDAGRSFSESMKDLSDGCKLWTIHASKGAEASDVVVFDGITGRIQDAIDSDAGARENEARTWYVALTRASERLHIVRDSFDWTDEYLSRDLEPRAARAAVDENALTDGGAGK